MLDGGGADQGIGQAHAVDKASASIKSAARVRDGRGDRQDLGSVDAASPFFSRASSALSRQPCANSI